MKVRSPAGLYFTLLYTVLYFILYSTPYREKEEFSE